MMEGPRPTGRPNYPIQEQRVTSIPPVPPVENGSPVGPKLREQRSDYTAVLRALRAPSTISDPALNHVDFLYGLLHVRGPEVSARSDRQKAAYPVSPEAYDLMYILNRHYKERSGVIQKLNDLLFSRSKPDVPPKKRIGTLDPHAFFVEPLELEFEVRVPHPEARDTGHYARTWVPRTVLAQLLQLPEAMASELFASVFTSTAIKDSTGINQHNALGPPSTGFDLKH